MKSGTKRASEGTKDNKKPYFQRSWTEEDEISLLQEGGVFEPLVKKDKEVVNWFEKSFLVRVVASLDVDECIVKWKWSKIEEKMKLVEAKELELLWEKIDVLREVVSVIAETI
ncbi:putative GLABROUS1 enhancer-binding protein family [Arabidopsis thaliana]